MPRITRWWIPRAFLLFIFLLFLPTLWNLNNVKAQPIYALREGVSCLTCHVSPTGGGLRNSFGESYGAQFLSTQNSGQAIPKSVGGITDAVRLGGDLRFLAQISEDPATPSTFDLMQWNLHAGVKISRDLQLVYTTNLAAMREAYLLLAGLPWEGLLKAGRFPLAYGWPIPDDTSSIRGGLGFGFTTMDTGLELSVYPSRTPFFAHLSATNGESTPRDANSLKALTVKLGVQHGHKMFGASYFSNTSAGIERTRVGFFDGIHIWNTTFLAEADYGRNRTVLTGATTSMLAGYFEVARRLNQNIQLRLKLDYLDPNRSVSSDEKMWTTLAAEYYPISSFAAELAYRLKSETPSFPDNEISLLLRSWF